MQGIIFSELKKYVDTKFGGDTWRVLLKEAGLGSRLYMPVQAYPDQEAVAIVRAAARATGKEVSAILEDFGEFIAPDLMSMFKAMIRPEWKTLDLIENIEGTIHKAVRVQNPGAKPLELKCSRPGTHEVVITYSSPRKMCAVAKGIVRGVARHYHERIAISEPKCMLKGSPSCEIRVRVEK